MLSNPENIQTAADLTKSSQIVQTGSEIRSAVLCSARGSIMQIEN